MREICRLDAECETAGEKYCLLVVRSTSRTFLGGSACRCLFEIRFQRANKHPKLRSRAGGKLSAAFGEQMISSKRPRKARNASITRCGAKVLGKGHHIHM